MPTTHHRKDCPGRCGRRIVNAMIACGPCVMELPEQIREANPADRVVVKAALAWYRQRNADAAMTPTTPAAPCGETGETL